MLNDYFQLHPRRRSATRRRASGSSGVSGPTTRPPRGKLITTPPGSQELDSQLPADASRPSTAGAYVPQHWASAESCRLRRPETVEITPKDIEQVVCSRALAWRWGDCWLCLRTLRSPSVLTHVRVAHMFRDFPPTASPSARYSCLSASQTPSRTHTSLRHCRSTGVSAQSSPKLRSIPPRTGVAQHTSRHRTAEPTTPV